MDIVSQTIAHSLHPVRGTCIFAGDIAKLVTVKKLPKTAVGGTLMASDTLWQAYINNSYAGL